MARFTEGNDREIVDQLVDTWRERCLIDEGSLLRPDEQLWTRPHLATLIQHFVDAQLEDERSFEEKITTQLHELDPDLQIVPAHDRDVWLRVFGETSPEKPACIRTRQ